MKKNMGSTDKIIRIILALIIIALYFSNVIEGSTALILLFIAAILIGTSIINFCPLYAPFGIKTCKTEKKRK